MSYYVDYRCDVRLPQRFEAEALAAVNALHTQEAIARNGGSHRSFARGALTVHGYAGVPQPPAGGFPTLRGACAAWQFSLREHPTDSSSYTLAWESGKRGDEEHLFRALAPYMEGRVHVVGEDGEHWSYEFAFGSTTDC